MELHDILLNKEKIGARKLNPYKALVITANDEKSDESYDALFRAFFNEPNLYFVAPVREDWEKSGPFIGNIQEQPCIFAFTEIGIAFDFCMKTNGFVWDEDKAFIMHLPMDECIMMFKQLSKNGVFGIRINEGSTGFFLPMTHLEGIVEQVLPQK